MPTPAGYIPAKRFSSGSKKRMRPRWPASKNSRQLIYSSAADSFRRQLLHATNRFDDDRLNRNVFELRSGVDLDFADLLDDVHAGRDFAEDAITVLRRLGAGVI